MTGKRKMILCAAAVLCAALIVGSLAAYYPIYLAWPDTVMLIVWPVLAALGAGGLGGIAAAAGDKPTKKKISVGAIVTAILFYGLQFGVSFLFNNILKTGEKTGLYDSNQFAIFIAYIMLFFFTAALLVVCAKRLSGKKAAAVVGVIGAVGVCAFSLGCFRAVIPMQWTYPIYRSFVAQGGVKTESDALTYGFRYATEKIQPTDNLTDRAEFTLQLAKNEREGCHLTVAARRDVPVSVSVGDLTNGDAVLKTAVYRESYLSIPYKGSAFSDVFPDALVPHDAADPVLVEVKRNQTFYIETVSAADTPAGTYTAPVTILLDGAPVAETTLTAEVWDFMLPEKPTCETAVGLNGLIFELAAGLENNAYAVNTWLTFYDGSIALTPEQEAVYKAYYDYLLEHKLCANFLPYDFLDDRADAYMSDPRVTAFCIPYPEDDEKLLAYWEKVQSNPEWAAKAYFYPVDEPSNEQGRMESFTERTARLKRLCPGYHMVCPFGYDTITDTEGNTMPLRLFEEGRADILCPIINCPDEDEAFADWLKNRQSLGDRAWWYVCCGPADDSGYCNLFTYQNGIKHRMMFWQEYAAGYQGFLYYDTCNWNFAGDPWNNPITFGAAENSDEAGDGELLYPGLPVGESGPVGSLRLKCVADGLDDFDYLALAAEKLGKEQADAFVRSLSASYTDYTLDAEELYAERARLGAALS